MNQCETKWTMKLYYEIHEELSVMCRHTLTYVCVCNTMYICICIHSTVTGLLIHTYRVNCERDSH